VTRYLTFAEVLELHSEIIRLWGGASGLRDVDGLEAAVAQPRMTFDDKELYPDLASKAAALCLSLVKNHPFIDGNKRVGHAAMEAFLMLNDYELRGTIEEQEDLMLRLADGRLSRDELISWVRQHIVHLNT
jgi:death on curing protein